MKITNTFNNNFIQNYLCLNFQSHLNSYQDYLIEFQQQSDSKEQEYFSDGESDSESKTFLSQFQVYQNLQMPKQLRKSLRLLMKMIHHLNILNFAAFKLMNIVINKQIYQDSQLDVFIQDKIIPNFYKLSSEKYVTIIQLFFQLSNKSFSNQIKKQIDQNLKNYTYLQLKISKFSFELQKAFYFSIIYEYLQCLRIQFTFMQLQLMYLQQLNQKQQ
ncbi:unnamed protein product [Paramecium pentaurelia]|uniref:Uncharacterized protein n=1 Tax=Paramecium pentaurelia TaxID=43138 RepID=A0A8S1TP97_9CILI|nr:unnamed protein product [Paramecium pentaurelia]